MADSPHRSLRHAARRAELGALAAEVGHELQGPINLFRSTQERLARGNALDDEDLALLEEELGRVGRLTARLRRLAQSSLELRVASPRELVEAALGWPPAEPPYELELELDPDPERPVRFTCDLKLLAPAVRELIDNAVEARRHRAGVRFLASPAAGLCVWDDGPGLELDVEQAMAWGETTRPGAAGLGLTLALRAARAHGFSLELKRTGSVTEAWLLIPPRALRVGSGPEPR